jgi:hypothetical protein
MRYKCMVVDAKDRVQRVEELAAGSDAGAMAEAERRFPRSSKQPLIEVWEDNRLVGRLGSPQEVPATAAANRVIDRAN